MSMNALTSLVLLPVMWLTRGIDFSEGTDNLFMLRVGFAASQLVMAALCAAVYLRMVAKAKTPDSLRKISFTPPKAPMATEEPVAREMTQFEYDSEQFWSFVKGNAFQLVFLLFLHYKWSLAIPLISQPLLGLTKVVSSELFLAYIVGQDIKRPFELPKSAFGDLAAAWAGEKAPEKKKAVKAKPVETKKAK